MIINLFTFWTRRRRSIYWITLLMGVISTATYVQAQTVALPDSGFCKCLKATRPQVIDANNELIILEAIKVQSIQCQNYNIKNVEGLQYFIKSTYIGLQDNQIDSLPDLDGYQLPFTANAVFILDMGGNQLKHLPKLPTTLPIILDLKINKLASLPAVDAPQNIRSLNIQMNPGMTLPDLSAFVNLEQLYASFNDWDAFPDLSTNTKLITIGLDHNKLRTLPDLSGLDLQSLHCENNLLTFEDLFSITNSKLYTAGKPNANFHYAPQLLIDIGGTATVALGSTYTLDLGFDAGVAGNSYTWKKVDDSFTATTSINKLTIPNFSSAQAGFYTASITNTTFDQLQLTTRKILLRPQGVSNYTIPDAAFRTCLKSINTNLFDSSDELIPEEAIKVSQIVCNGYEISDITGVHYFSNIGLLNISSSNLVTLPALPLSINSLVLEDNKLTSLAGIAVLKDVLSYLRVGGNPDLERPDLSTFSNLAHFSCRNNKWKTLPDFSGVMSLGSLDLSDNLLDSLPNLTSLSNLSNLECLFNNLTFSDLLKADNPKLFNTSGTYTEYYRYESQNKVGVPATVTLAAGASHTIDLDIDDDLNTNIYTWFLNGDSIATTTVNTLVVGNFDISKEGVYTAVVTNPQLPLLRLHSHDIRLSATPDQHISIPDANFRQCLRDSMPQVLDVDGKLIPNEANQILFLTCSGRQIKDLSGIEQFKNLALLDCRNNELTSIPDLEGITSAAKGYGFDLICLGNQLTQLPKLPSNTTMVMAYQNKLSSISSIAQQGNIHILSVGENPNLAIPDLSKMPNLTFLDCRSNNWDTLPNLSNNTLLQMLHINGNNLRNLPDLSSLDSLRFINCAKNKLTFEDLLQIDNPLVRAQDKIKNNFFYILQDTVGSAQNIALVEGGSYVIKLGIDEAVTSNSYTWYKNGQMLTTTNAPELIVNSPGIYTCAVSNSIFTQLVLWSHATTVTAAPWTPVIAGDQNQIMIIPSDVSAIIEGSGLEAGDYIGAFFHSSDNAALICGAQTQWTGVNTTLTLYANTSVTNKNGFDPNEAFVIKVWKTAKQKEYLVNAQYRTDSAFAQGFYASNAVVKVSSLHFAACQGQTLSLYKGWNLISLNVIPDNNHMSSLFNGIGPLVVKNAAGNIMYAPQNGITSGIWNTQEGYLVYVSQNHVLSVCGTAIDPNTTIAIPQQNYPYFLPYFAKSQRTLSTALSPFIGQLQYVQSMEYAPTANSIVAYNYIPEHVITPAVNEIVNMRPGLAYKVMVNTTIPAFQYSTGDGLRLYDEEKPEVDTSVSRFSKHFGLAAITTGKNSVLVISQALIEPSLSKGDEIAVFAPDHTLVGSAVYTKASVAITLWEHPNMSAGEGYVFKYWKRNENAEGTLELPVTVSKNHVNFKVLNPEVTHMDDLEVSSVAEVTGYPNPASDKFVLNIRCVAPHAAKLVISSAIGTVLDQVTDLNLKVGENELIYSTEGLTNGVYTYQLKIDNEVIRGKFSVAK